VPVRRAAFTQQWTCLTYLHWPYDPSVVAPLLPAGTRPDVIDGVTWVGLIPFAMRRVALFGRMPLPYLSSFLECNVRLYSVDERGRRGVVFLSLDADRLLPVLAARVSYGLPYCWSRSRLRSAGDEVSYEVGRRWPGPRGATCRLRVRLGDPVQPTPLDDFLTARWGLHNRRAGTTFFAPVDHDSWPLRSATLLELDESLVRAAGLPDPVGAPRVLHSDGVSVRVGWPRSAGR